MTNVKALLTNGLLHQENAEALIFPDRLCKQLQARYILIIPAIIM